MSKKLMKLKEGQRYLFATDLDGTFMIDHDGSFHISAYPAVKQIEKEGHIFVITTGRAQWWAKKIYELLDLKTAGIYNSGAHIIHPKDPNFNFVDKPIKLEEIKQIINKFDLLNKASTLIINGKDKFGFLTHPEDLQYLDFDSYEFVIGFRDDKYNKELFTNLESTYKHDYVIRRWDYRNEAQLVFSAKDTDKWIGLAHVSKHYNIPQSNVIYFGDNVNDIGALQWAGYSYAVANAKDEIKQYAKEVLELTNKEGAVSKKILWLLNNKEK